MYAPAPSFAGFGEALVNEPRFADPPRASRPQPEAVERLETSVDKQEKIGEFFSRADIRENEMAATSRVTREVLDSYLRCKTKGFLTLAGRHGIESDYERWRIESGERQRFRATVNLLVRYRGYQVSKGIVLLASRLREGVDARMPR